MAKYLTIFLKTALMQQFLVCVSLRGRGKARNRHEDASIIFLETLKAGNLILVLRTLQLTI